MIHLTVIVLAAFNLHLAMLLASLSSVEQHTPKHIVCTATINKSAVIVTLHPDPLSCLTGHNVSAGQSQVGGLLVQLIVIHFTDLVSTSVQRGCHTGMCATLLYVKTIDRVDKQIDTSCGTRVLSCHIAVVTTRVEERCLVDQSLFSHVHNVSQTISQTSGIECCLGLSCFVLKGNQKWTIGNLPCNYKFI